MMRNTLCLIPALALLFLARPALAQSTSPAPVQQPRTFGVLGLRVEGAEDATLREFIRQRSGLAVGQRVTIPGDPALADAIRTLYQFRHFADVKIVEERREGDGVYLVIQVQEEPRLAGYTFEGVKKDHQKELKHKLPLFTGTRLRPSDVERSVQLIRVYFEEKGYLLAEVETRQEATENGEVTLAFAIDRGPRVEVGDVVVEGNEALSDGRVRKQMKQTGKKRWWRFWGKKAFDADAFEEDKARVVAYYHEKGYYDARIVSDSVYVQRDGGTPEIIVELRVYEGPRYHIRHVIWDGNTVFEDAVLTEALGFAPGDPYDNKKLEQNLYANPRSTDVASLYYNRGYMRFNAQPTITVADGDSLDLHFDVFEGGVYTFGEIGVAGNLSTNDHVIQRELYTTPGLTFSRAAIQESIRRLAHLNYFDQTSLAMGPEVQVDDEKQQVNLTYNIQETNHNPLTVQGTVGNNGLILQLGLTHNNFSLKNLFKGKAWQPLPTGDGQQFSLGVQTSGRNYQRYSLSFTEPWFRGKPTPLGFSLSHTRIKDDFFSDTDNDGTLLNTSARLFYDQRLKWPDDKFSLSSSVRYQHYNNNDWTESLPLGVSRELVFRQALTRNALDHPVFPTQGSVAQLSVEIAPPFPGFTQYHKWRLQTNWNTPLTRKISFGVSADFGYVGSLTGEEVDFQRFVVGGSPFQTQNVGGDLFGRDIVYMRGYPIEAIGPRRDGTPVGGRLLNKYSAELRWHAVQTPQLTAMPYLFFDAANAWNSFGDYNPTNLFRSAGLGARLTLPMLGLVEISYGYNFDTFSPLGDHDGTRGWGFQFSLGRTFNF